MIRDLNTEEPDGAQAADVVVVGAGIVGLLIATWLARKGFHVLVLESGGEHQIEDTHPLNEVEQLGSVYAGAAHGRFRCLGGTSTRWGGAMIPMLRADLEQDPNGAWPVRYEALSRYIPELEKLFGLPSNSYEDPTIVSTNGRGNSAFIARFAKWPPFRLRNVANLFNQDIQKGQGLQIWLNATVSGFSFAADGKVASVQAMSMGGRQLKVQAREVVVAAGAIESTRLLLLADRATENRLYAPHDVLGRYFHDHLSIEVADVVPTSRRRMNRVVGFRFEKGGMRNLRFEPSESPAIRAELSPCFAHINFSEQTGSGFDTIREIYRRLQQRRLPDLATAMRLVAGAPWIARAVWWRFFEHRLLYPDEATIQLHMVIEQQPRPENRIVLSEARRDIFGLPLAAIDWHVTEEDQERLTTSVDKFFNFWNATNLCELGVLHRYPAGSVESNLFKGGGIYHPGGSTRMGSSIRNGVVDSQLRCFGIPNMSIVATSVFPTGGGANPTMMLMLAGLRFADKLGIGSH